MPRDSRLYMTFPNSFPWHKKITRLSVEARWAFVEMNGYSRVRDLDGVIPAVDAEFEWGQAILYELVGSHPARPLVFRDGDNYVIREYAEHQQTKAARAAKSDAGAKAANARWDAKRMRDASGAHANAIQESRVQSPEDLTHLSESQSLDNRENEWTDSLSPAATTLAKLAGIRDVAKIRSEIYQRTGCDISLDRTVGVARWLIEKSKKPVQSADAYIAFCLTNSAAEIQQHIYGD